MCRDNEIDLRLGVCDGQLLFIDEVERGLDCNCYCPHCGGRLVAKKGEIKEHHFAHYTSDNCGKGMETALHLLGKQVLLNEEMLILPDSTEPVGITAPSIERRRFGYIADVGAVLTTTGEELDIEIKVTHGVDDKKRASVLQQGALMVEIDLSELLTINKVTREIVTERVIRDAPRTWIRAEQKPEAIIKPEDSTMGDKYLVVGFKSVSGYSRKYQSNFETDRLHVLVELEDRPTRNYQVHAIAGYEQQNVPIKLTPTLTMLLEQQSYPAWAELKFDTQLVNGTPKALVTEVNF